MMELALIRTMLDKEFYDNHKGIRCPDKIFSKDARKIKQTLDYAMDTYGKNITPTELESLFFVNNTSMTTANKLVFSELFQKVAREKPLSTEIADDVLSKLFQQVVGEEIANLGFDYVNGSQSSLEPLRNILSNYQDDFLPNLKVEWDDTSIDTLLKANDIQSQWKWNIPTLKRRTEGISAGHLVVVGARPNTGKTSFHASTIAAPDGFASQGAKCMVLCNEESYERVGARYLSAATSMSMDEVKTNMAVAALRYDPVEKNVFIKDSTGKDMAWVEAIIKAYEPDIVVLDMGDKFARTGGFARPDEALKANAIYARQIAKAHNCAIFYMSQLSADAEGKVLLNQSMMEGSRTGKAAEADLMVLIAKNPVVDGQEEEDTQRHLNVVKNKLSGWHGVVHCELEYKTARYLV